MILIYDATLPYDLKVITGVAAYVQRRANWELYIEENSLKDQRLPNFRGWRADGIIADFDDARVARAVMASGVRTVGFGGGYGWYDPASGIPYFFTNNEKIALMAANDLLSRGFRRFAFAGYQRTKINSWSDDRARAFARCVGEAGFSCSIYLGHHTISRNWASLTHSLSAWLLSLPKPVGLMAANDKLARQVLEGCRTVGLRVPEDVAVIGVDNDEMLCQLSNPPLSSVEQGARRIGYEAARLLDRMMSRRTVRSKRFVVDPVGIVTRRSSDVLAIVDVKVAQALTFIRRHACDGIKIGDVASAVAISRSGLEARFKLALHRTLHGEIRRIRLERAQDLISNSDLPLKEIAAEAGFSSIQHLTAVFHQALGETPARFRQQAKATQDWARPT